MNVVIPGNKRYSYPIAGGLGAQIFGAATAFYLRGLGNVVNVDLTYFDIPPFSALEGATGIPSVWCWELNQLGIEKREVSANAINQGGEEVTPSVGWLSAVSSLALQDPRVLSRFTIPSIEKIERELQLSISLSEPYTAVHLRRGDYLNCSSFVVPSSAAYDCAYRAGRYVRNLLIVSDSGVDAAQIKDLYQKFSAIDVITNKAISPVTLWALFTYATVLVTSNSQFSLSAGYFSNGVVFSPDQYVGNGDRISNTLYKRMTPFFLYKASRQDFGSPEREVSLLEMAHQ